MREPVMLGYVRRQPLTVVVIAVAMLAASAIWLFSPGQASTLEGGPALPRSAEMKPGDRALFPDGQYIEFVGMAEDSRCPADAFCIWQGRAVVEFEVAGEQVLLTFIGGDTIGEAIAGYVVTIEDVQPYPLASQPTADEDYRVTVTVSQPK